MTTLASLKALVDPPEKRNRMKFAVKLFHVLQQTTANRTLLPETGAIWCSDGEHFLVNSKVLGKLLGLKSNSVNTNFRDHGFIIVGPLLPSDLEFSQDLPDPIHWKKRRNGRCQFTAASTIEDAEAIPTVDPKSPQPESASPSLALQFAFVPNNLRELLPNDGFERDLVKVVSTIVEISQSKEWYRQVLETATNLWVTKCGNSPVVPFTVWQDRFFPLTDDDRAVCQMRLNCTALLKTHAGCSQMAQDVYFLDFFKLFLRFGSADGFSERISEVSDFSEQSDDFWQGEEFERELAVQFKDGFCFRDQASARERLGEEALDVWVVTQSRVPNRFTVLINGGPGMGIVAIQVDYFAIPNQNGVRFSSLEPKSGTPGVAQSWNELLFNVLKLEEKNGLKLGNLTDRPVKYVGSQEVAMRNAALGIPPELSLPPLDDFNI